MTATERKNKFIDYLSEKFSEKRVDDIIYALEQVESFMIKKSYISCKFYEVDQPDHFYDAMLSTSKNRLFRLLNRKIYDSIEVGMKNYLEFLYFLVQKEAEQLAVEKAELERLAAEKAEAERLAAEKAEAERLAAEKAEKDRLAAEKAETERIAVEKAEAERLAAEKAEMERLLAEKMERERLADERRIARRRLKKQKELTVVIQKFFYRNLKALISDLEQIRKIKVFEEQTVIAKKSAEAKQLEVEKAAQEHLENENVEYKHQAAETKEGKLVDLSQSGFFSWAKEKGYFTNIGELRNIFFRLEKICFSVKVLNKPLIETTDIDTLKEVREVAESSKVLHYNMQERKNQCISAVDCYMEYLRECNLTIDTPSICDASVQEKPKKKTIRSIVWEEDEIELLIDTFYKIQDKKMKRADAIRMISVELRRRAEINYIVPDDFRNEKSVENRLAAVEYYCTNGRSGLQTTSRLIERVLEKKKSSQNVITTDKSDTLNNRRIILSEISADAHLWKMQPISMYLLGIEYKCDNWKELYTIFGTELFKKYPIALAPHINRSFSGRGTIDLADTTHFYRMTDPVNIGVYNGEKIFLERLASPTFILSNMKMIAEKCSLDLAEISIDLKRESTQEVGQKQKETKTRQNRVPGRQEFYEWLLAQGLKKGSASGYLVALDRCSEFLNKEAIIDKNIFSIFTANELSKIRIAIDTQCDKYQRTRFKSPFNKYCLYCDTIAAQDGMQTETAQETIKKTRQPLWDEYEAVILLNALLAVRNGTMLRKDAAEEVSHSLRQRALSMGQEIDDRFRNVAGIEMQMGRMEYSLTNGEKGLNPSSELFKNVVKLYKEDQLGYRKLLREAKKQIQTLDEKQPEGVAIATIVDEQQSIENKEITAQEDAQVPVTLAPDTNSFVVPEELFRALGERAKHMVSTYLIAYTQDSELRQELQNYWDDENASLDSIAGKKINAENEEANTMICDFLRWCTFDLQQEITSFIHEITHSHESEINMIYDKYSILSKIAAVRDGDMILTPVELEEYFGENTDKVLTLLHNCKSDSFSYDSYTDTFIVDNNTLADRVQEYIKELPDVFHKNRLHYILQQAESKEGISAEILGIAIQQSYKLKLNQYRRKVTQSTDNNTFTAKTDAIVDYLLLHDIPYIDNRKKNGALWIIGGDELKDTIALFRKSGAKCGFMKHGGRTTRGQSAWWTNSVITELVAETSISTEEKMELPVSTSVPVMGLQEEITVEKKRRIAYIDWLKTRGTNQGIIFLSIQLLKQCSQYAKSMKLLENDIFTLETQEDVENLIDSLLKDSEFIKNNQKQGNRLYVELIKYKEFIEEYHTERMTESTQNDIIRRDVDDSITTATSMKVIQSDNRVALPSQYKIDEQKQPSDLSSNICYSLLKEKFPKGFRAESKIELRKFKKIYAIEQGEEPSISDEEILNEIKKVTIRHDKMLYLPDMMLSAEKKEKLLRYINRIFAEGKNVIYYTALFAEFSDEFLGERIHNAEILKTYLEYVNDGRYYINCVYLAKDRNIQVDPLDELIEILRQKTSGPITVEQLCEELPHLPKNLIVDNLKLSPEIICNKRGESYFHVSAIDLDDSELENIARIIQNEIDTQQFETSSEMRSAIRRMYPDIIERYESFSENGFRDALAYRFRDRFTFNANIISARGTTLTTSDVYANFCKTHDHFTMGELNLLKEELGAVIYFDKVYENALRINQNEFVSFDTVVFDVPAIDEAIGQYCTGEYISLKDIDDFGGFPYIGVVWNSYLLEHFVSMFSEKYKLIHTVFAANSCSGAIVRKDAKIDTLDQLLITELAKSGHTASVNDAFDYLIERGYLSGRGLQRMDKIVVDAKVQRSKKG